MPHVDQVLPDDPPCGSFAGFHGPCAYGTSCVLTPADAEFFLAGTPESFQFRHMISATPSILLVSAETRLRSQLHSELERGGYRVEEAVTGRTGMEALTERKPDVVVVDLDMPDTEGREWLRRVREWSSVPLLAISAQPTVAGVVRALDAGADDCLTRHFDITEMLSRLRAILRRLEREPADSSLSIGPLKMDFMARLVTVKGCEVHLTPIEYSLLRLLAVHVGRVITQRQLLRDIWGTESAAQSRHLRVHLSNMKRKLGTAGFDAGNLKNEPGVGYRLVSSG